VTRATTAVLGIMDVLRVLGEDEKKRWEVGDKRCRGAEKDENERLNRQERAKGSGGRRGFITAIT